MGVRERVNEKLMYTKVAVNCLMVADNKQLPSF